MLLTISIDKTASVDPRAKISENVYIGKNVRIYGPSHIGEGTIIRENVIIGDPKDQELNDLRLKLKGIQCDISISDCVKSGTFIGKNCTIRSGTVIYSGVKIGDYFNCYRNVLICPGVTIGDRVYIMANTIILLDATIGDDCRIGGFICDRSVIEDRVSMLGYLLHKYNIPVGGLIEPAPIIKKGATVGMLACVIGKVIIGEEAYVGAGTTVTRDVEPKNLVVGIHRIVRREY